MPSKEQIEAMRARQKDVNGSVVFFQGNSGTGKSHEATEAWLKSGMEHGGACIAYDPVGDIQSNIDSYLLGYQRKVDRLRRENKSIRDSAETIGALKVQDYLRNNVICCPGMSADNAFETVAGYVGESNPTGFPRFALLIDEGSQARKNSGFLESIVPIMRNLHGKAFITAHRSMAIPPQVRSVLSGRVLWYSSDGTGDEALEHEIRSIAEKQGKPFQFSPVMGRTKPEDQWYRGIRYGADGPEAFEYNPNISKRPDWILLPGNPTRVQPRELRG